MFNVVVNELSFSFLTEKAFENYEKQSSHVLKRLVGRGSKQYINW